MNTTKLFGTWEMCPLVETYDIQHYSIPGGAVAMIFIWCECRRRNVNIGLGNIFYAVKQQSQYLGKIDPSLRHHIT